MDTLSRAKAAAYGNHSITYPSLSASRGMRTIMGELIDIIEAHDKSVVDMKVLAGALSKFAPDLAAELIRRWKEANKTDDQRLEDFLKILREE